MENFMHYTPYKDATKCMCKNSLKKGEVFLFLCYFSVLFIIALQFNIVQCTPTDKDNRELALKT